MVRSVANLALRRCRSLLSHRFKRKLETRWMEDADLPCSQGPDEVHIQQIGKRELKRVEELQSRTEKIRRKSEKLLKEGGKERAKL